MMTGDSFQFPLLLGDVGATNTRLALMSGPGEPLDRLPDIATAGHPDPAAAIAAATAGTMRPRGVLLAVAGPVGRDQTRLTNAPWLVEPHQVVARLGLAALTLVNDFEALALALPDLGADDLYPLGPRLPAIRGTRLVVGPGTGLGAAALLDIGGRFVPVAGEGGHISLAPADARDAALWPHVDGAKPRVSAEMLVSGPGLVRLHRALAAADGRVPRFANPADITAAGLAGDPEAGEVLDRFARYLGRVAGDLALVFLAGAVFIGGGIAPRLAERLGAGPFRAEFSAKPPYEARMAAVPTAVITKPDAALAGLAALVTTPDRFLLDIDGRTWRA